MYIYLEKLVFMYCLCLFLCFWFCFSLNFVSLKYKKVFPLNFVKIIFNVGVVRNFLKEIMCIKLANL